MPCILPRWRRHFLLRGEEAAKELRLLLNCLYMISEGKTDLHVVKAVFELRTMSECGFLPQLVCCKICEKYDGPAFYLDPQEGILLCEDCAKKGGQNLQSGHGCLVCPASYLPCRR